jgi:hypothetical protein
MLLLYALKTGNATTNWCGERLDVSGGPTNEGTELALDHLDEFGILRKDGSSGSAIEFLCEKN